MALQSNLLPPKRRHINSQERQQWALLLQTLLIDGLAEHCRWTGKDIAFHGGTSLKLVWGSPRWSEDLDFLLRQDLLADSADLMHDAIAHMKAILARLDKDLNISLKEKKIGKMARYEIVANKTYVMGNAVVKAEFWGVKDSYLDRYESTNKLSIPPRELTDIGYFVRVRSAFPVATLNSMLCDKIVAAANRPYLKSRDIFDIWWLQQERDFKKIDSDALAEQVMFHTSAYESMDQDDPALSMIDRLHNWTDQAKNKNNFEKIKAELKRFLVITQSSVNAWNQYWGTHVPEMIEIACATVENCINGLEHMYAEKESEGYARRPKF